MNRNQGELRQQDPGYPKFGGDVLRNSSIPGGPLARFDSQYMEVVSLHVQSSTDCRTNIPAAFYVEIQVTCPDRHPVTFQTPVVRKSGTLKPPYWGTRFDISPLDRMSFIQFSVKDWRALSEDDPRYRFLTGKFTLKELIRSGKAAINHTFPVYLRADANEGHSLLVRFTSHMGERSDIPNFLRHSHSMEPVASSRWVDHSPAYRHSDGYSLDHFMRSRDLTEDITSVSRPSAYGGHSDIYVGQWRTRYGIEKVAIKVMRTNTVDRSKFYRRLRRELHVWTLLRHPNILPLEGYYQGFGDDLGLVSPWCVNGDINNYLRSHDKNPSLKELKYRLLQQVLQGLEYLHTHAPPIIHADLKGANILVSDMGMAQLCDFGTASMRDETQSAAYATSSVGGTCRWMAPELFESDKPIHSFESDVYSFGCVVFEVLSGHAPFHDLLDARVIVDVTQGKRPPRADDTDDDAWCLMTDCWKSVPSERPSVQELKVCVEELWQSNCPASNYPEQLDESSSALVDDECLSEDVQPAESIVGVDDYSPPADRTRPDTEPIERAHTVHYGWKRTVSPEPLESVGGTSSRSPLVFLPETVVTTIRYGKGWFTTTTTPSEDWDDKRTVHNDETLRGQGVSASLEEGERRARSSDTFAAAARFDFALRIDKDGRVQDWVPLTLPA